MDQSRYKSWTNCSPLCSAVMLPLIYPAQSHGKQFNISIFPTEGKPALISPFLHRTASHYKPSLFGSDCVSCEISVELDQTVIEWRPGCDCVAQWDVRKSAVCRPVSQYLLSSCSDQAESNLSPHPQHLQTSREHCRVAKTLNIF